MAEHSSDDVEAPPITRKSLMTANLPKMLNLEEKKYLLAIERSDMSNIKRMLQVAHRKKHFDINCVDSLGRGALTISIDQENLEMVELLIIMGVETRDALLHAINVEFVEAVELLLEHEELIHKEGELYSWQKVDHNTACFTPDITPLVLAAHRNNYEILKILLDRGATVPMPHDIKCGCEECIKQSAEDSLRHSLSRLNEYKALASPSLIALSSSDPILTAFQLSWELRNLAFAEPECKSEYMDLRRQCQQFAVDLLHQSRSSHELAIILNHDPQSPAYVEGEHMKLTRLELAIQYKQKKFVAHPNIQQLLAAIWYEGVPGFRRKSSMLKFAITIKVALLFPFYSMLYILAPETRTGKLMRKPFMKFLVHASSYLFFLLILILVSQRAEDAIIENFGTESMRKNIEEKNQRQRGNPPMILEYVVLIYVIGFIFEETHEIYIEGIQSYLRNMWNFIDFTRNFLYTAVIVLRMAAYVQQSSEIMEDPLTAYIRREEWAAFDFQLVAEGLFAAANIFSALKLVHLFSINPHLGPLQISLGRMVIDIVKFFFIYSLVLFAFACGLNQLLWYFSDLEKKKCYHFSNGTADFDNFGDSCMKWRNFANVFETSQSLFWASFGLVDLSSFELTGIKTYTRFWGLLMFGSYSVINVIVLLNLLIAMMSNSYAIIDEHSDTEWKFARTKLWMSYFEESATLPPPFNIFPTPKLFFKLLGLRKKDKLRKMSTKRRNREEKERDYKYSAVMRALVWRYVAAMHRKEEENPVTEDDINELKSDISSFRYEMMDVLHKNGMNVSASERKEKAILGKKNKIWERRLMKDFKVGPVATEEDEDLLFAPPPENEHPTAKFRRIARMAIMNTGLNKWRQVIKGACIASQIGHCHSRDSFTKLQNLQKAMHEAKKFSNKTPAPSRSITPIHLPDTTGSNIMDIIRDFKNDDKDDSSSFIVSPSPDNILFDQKPNNLPMDVLLLAGETLDLINLESQKNTPRKCTSPPSFKYILGEDDNYKKMSSQKYIRAPQPQYPNSTLCRSDETQISNSEVRMGSREIIEEYPSSSEDVLNTLSESQSNDDAYVDKKDPVEQESISDDSFNTEHEHEILHESKDSTLLETNDEGLDKALALDEMVRNHCISPELKITGADGEDIPLKSPSKVAKSSNQNTRSEIEKYEVLIHKNIRGAHIKQEVKETSMPSISSVGEDMKSDTSITMSEMPPSTSSSKGKSSTVASGSDEKLESAVYETTLPIQSLGKEMKLETDIAIASPTKTISDKTKPEEALVSSAALSVHSTEIPISGSKNVTQEKSPMASRNISRIHDRKRIQRKTGWL